MTVTRDFSEAELTFQMDEEHIRKFMTEYKELEAGKAGETPFAGD